MLKTYHGSCHCGAVRFEADIDLAQPTYRCNCSICARNRFWAAVVEPSAVRVLEGRGELVQYLFNSMQNEHRFCRTCGVRPYGIGRTPDDKEVYGVNIGCLDDATPRSSPRRRSPTATGRTTTGSMRRPSRAISDRRANPAWRPGPADLSSSRSRSPAAAW